MPMSTTNPTHMPSNNPQRVIPRSEVYAAEVKKALQPYKVASSVKRISDGVIEKRITIKLDESLKAISNLMLQSDTDNYGKNIRLGIQIGRKEILLAIKSANSLDELKAWAEEEYDTCK